MTLTPVSNISLRGSSSRNGGGSRWMSQRSSIPGSASAGNSTSTTGPAMATTRPSLSSVSVRSGAMVMEVAPRCSLVVARSFCVGADAEVLAQGFLVASLPRVAQRLCATDDLGDLGGDGVLPGAVHHPPEVHDELVGVLARGLHRPLPRRLLGRRCVEERGEDARLDVSRQEPFEDLAGVGLELVPRPRTFRLPGAYVLVAHDLA